MSIEGERVDGGRTGWRGRCGRTGPTMQDQLTGPSGLPVPLKG